MTTSPLGIGGAPMRATTLPETAKERKEYPIASGVLDYFPDALAAVAHVSFKGNEQHNKGKSLHWDRSKSDDEADTLLRHFLQRGAIDVDGLRHSAKMVWRALALLQKEIEAEKRIATEPELEWPRYYFSPTLERVYRATHAQDIGVFWSGNEARWIKSSSPHSCESCLTCQYPWKRITREEAVALGAQP